MSQKELARIAFQALLNEVEGNPPAHDRHEYELTTNLVLRRSTGLAAGGKASTTSSKKTATGRSRKITADV
jgi:hypothetical protein